MESPADAAVREMWEETGLFSTPIRILGIYGGHDFMITYSNGDMVSYVLVAFESRIIGGKMSPDGVETLEIGYFSESNLAELNLPTWMQIVLSDAFNHSNTVHFKAPTWKPPGV